MGRIWHKIEPYFRYTRAEKRGIVVLIVVLIVLLITRISLPHLLNKHTTIIEIETLAAISSNELLEADTKTKSDLKNSGLSRNTSQIDPNTATFEKLIENGLSTFAASNIIKYRSKGGQFHKIDDLKTIYGMESMTTTNLQKIFLIDTTQFNTIKKAKVVTSNIKLVELNTADTTELKSLPAIGSKLGLRIVKYRELLGGFSKVEQLLEVYGLNSELLDKFKPFVTIDTLLILKIDLNKSTEQELSKHPYISNYQAKAIIKLRQINGKIDNPESIVKNKILTQEEFEKLQAYIVNSSK